MSWDGGYLGDLGGLRELLGYFCSGVGSVVGLHPCRHPMPSKPLFENDLVGGLGIVFVVGAKDGFCKFGEKIDDN